MKKVWVVVVILGLGIAGFMGEIYYKNNSSTQQATTSNKVLNSNMKNSNSTTSSTSNSENSNVENSNENSTSEGSNNQVGTKSSNNVSNQGNYRTANSTNNESSINNSRNLEGNNNIRVKKETDENNQSNSKEKVNNDGQVLNYMGIWEPSTEVLWNQSYNTNTIPTKEQLNENNLTLTQSQYSFKGITVNNPSYEIVKRKAVGVFGNMRMGGYGAVNNNYSDYGSDGAMGNSPSSDLDFIVPIPQGASSSYVENATQGFNIFNYPYIVNGKMYATLNTGSQPIYEFNR